jgi:hypothetical protein
MKTSYSIRIIVFVAALLVLSNCASQLPPGGGEIDTTPPEIIKIYPHNGSVNYSDDYFEITFSEYVDKRSVQEAIFISPPLNKSLKYDWSGRSLAVYIQDTLKTNTTYTVTIGAEVADLNNKNKMVEPFTFAFSTGNQVDSGKISGRIYNDSPSGAMVYAYLKNDKAPDPTLQKPDYISQVGTNGKYTLLGLSEGEYQVFAVRDRFRDFLYNRNDDEFGVQFKELKLSASGNEIFNCDFYLNIEDTIPPKLTSVVMRDRNHFLLEFSESIDSTKISSSNFFIFDSTLQKQIPVIFFFKGNARPKQFYLAIRDSLIKGNEIALISQNIVDNSGSINLYESTSITPKADPDTTAPKLLKVFGSMPDEKVDFEFPLLTLNFDDGFSQENINSACVIDDGKGSVMLHEIDFIDDASFKIRIPSKLRQRSEYYLKLDLSKIIDAAGNKVDSIYTHKFTTNSELDFSGISGIVKNVNGNDDLFIELKSVGKDKMIYQKKVNQDKTFVINKILPGKYLLSSFVDKNKNSKYDPGSIKPFNYAERFTFYPDTLNLRARWPVGDLMIEY